MSAIIVGLCRLRGIISMAIARVSQWQSDHLSGGKTPVRFRPRALWEVIMDPDILGACPVCGQTLDWHPCYRCVAEGCDLCEGTGYLPGCGYEHATHEDAMAHMVREAVLSGDAYAVEDMFS